MKRTLTIVGIIVVALLLMLAAYCTYQPVEKPDYSGPVEETTVEIPKETTQPVETIQYDNGLPKTGGPKLF